MSLVLFRLFAAIVCAVGVSAPAFSAEVTVIKTSGGISRIAFDGAIESGDYERLLEAVLNAGVDINTIALASAGGDAIEAMRIGRLIRALGLTVEAPRRFDTGNVCPVGIKKRPDCSCDSACLFLYLGAVNRYGDALGVHRVFLNPNLQRRISLDESRQVSRAIEDSTRQFLEEMHAPPTLLDYINSAASDSTRILPAEYVKRNLYGYTRDIEDWLIAKCGSASRAFARFLRNPDSADGARALAAHREIESCFDHHLRADRLAKFRPVVAEALRSVDAKRIAPGSMLAFAQGSRSVGFASIVGMPIDDAARLLAVFGFGYQPSRVWQPGQGYTIARTVLIGVSEARTASSVDLAFWGEPGGEVRPFAGQFVHGLDQTSKPSDFLAKFGKPFRQGRDFGGNPFFLFEHRDYDLSATFSAQGDSLIRVGISPRGYHRRTLGQR
jgi:hypothetical protein